MNKIKYELISTNDYEFELEKTIAKNRNLKDIRSFDLLDETSVIKSTLLDNIDIGIDLLVKHFQNKSKILIIVDSDVDGYTSAALAYNFLLEIYEKSKLSFHVHEKKIHGIKPKDIVDYDYDLLIVPDAGSNDYEAHKLLSQKKKDILILDHHMVEKYSEYAVVINNQLSKNYPNKQLSGVGIVYKFFQRMTERFNLPSVEKYLDLVALGCVADSMDLREKETRYLINQGLKNPHNHFIKQIIEDSPLVEKYNITAISFSIAPMLNAMIRMGDLEDKRNLFTSLIDNKKKIEYTNNRKKETTIVLLYKDMVRRITNAKNRQQSAVKKILKVVKDQIDSEDNQESKITILTVPSTHKDSLSGLLANKIANITKKPTIVLKKTSKGQYRGSGRGYEMSGVENLQGAVHSIDSNIFAQGHENAFGILFNSEDQLKNFQMKLSAMSSLEDSEASNNYKVDFIIKSNSLRPVLFKAIHELQPYFGQGIRSPLLALEDLIVRESNIKERPDGISFNVQGIEIVVDGNHKEIIDTIREKKVPIIINAVGKVLCYKDFKKNLVLQFRVDNYEITGEQEQVNSWF